MFVIWFCLYVSLCVACCVCLLLRFPSVHASTDKLLRYPTVCCFVIDPVTRYQEKLDDKYYLTGRLSAYLAFIRMSFLKWLQSVWILAVMAMHIGNEGKQHVVGKAAQVVRWHQPLRRRLRIKILAVHYVMKWEIASILDCARAGPVSQLIMFIHQYQWEPVALKKEEKKS